MVSGFKIEGSLLLLEVELMETLPVNNPSFVTSRKSLLLLEVELMETATAAEITKATPNSVASIIRSGINGNEFFKLHIDFLKSSLSLLLLEVELMETYTP